MDERFDRELRSVIIGDWKLVQRRPGGVRLYHLTRDPGELNDLAAGEPERRAELEAQLDSPATPPARPAGEPKAGPDILERLRALGYVE